MTGHTNMGYLVSLHCWPQWPYILGQGFMPKQHRPRIRTICHTIRIFNIYFGFTSPQWPNILGQESITNSTDPDDQGLYIYYLPYQSYLYLYCAFTSSKCPYTSGRKCMHKQGIPKPAPSAISPISMLLHPHNGPLYWDRSCIHYQNGQCIGTEVYAQTVQTKT